jgi:hypothetical protein
MDEWSVGEYERVIALPSAVNAQLANVTLGNGVLVVALPLSDRTIPARLTLNPIGPAKGERAGNAGHPVRPLSTDQHAQDKAARRQEAGPGVADDDVSPA